MWQSWVSAILGVWVIILSFIPGLRNLASLLIPGIVVLILGVWGGLSKGKSA
jgi:hypothetical protein